MPTLRVTVTADIDGANVDGFPFTHMVQTDVSQPFEFQMPGSSPPVGLPDTLITTLQALMLRTDKPLLIQLNGVTGTVVSLNPGGMLLILDCDQNGDKASSFNSLLNGTANLATVKGVAMGA